MGQKYALIIGDNEYDDSSLARLLTPAADVVGLAAVLKATDIGGFEEVISLVNEPSIRVRREIARFFCDKHRDDLLLLYFSGHGVLDNRSKLYLAAKDTEGDLLKGTAIEASFITDVMEGSYSRQQMLIRGCCHSGTFARRPVANGCVTGHRLIGQRIPLSRTLSSSPHSDPKRCWDQNESSIVWLVKPCLVPVCPG